MNSLTAFDYVLLLAASLLISLLLTPLALSAATRRGILDLPGPRKSHIEAVPYLGGAAIVVSFAVVIVVASAFRPIPGGFADVGAILGLGTALSLVGLVDDLRRGISPAIRVAFEIAAAIVVYLLGNSLAIAGLPSWLDAVATVLWILGITNAFNLLDNMDGLSAGIAALTASGIFGVAYVQGRYLVAAFAVALVGCACGFLRHNFHPARIYMGDAGSLFLGFILAVLLVKLRSSAPTRVSFVTILSAAGMAIFDTSLVVVARLLNGRSPLQGGRDHASHRLVRSGLSVRQAVVLLYAATAVLELFAIFMWRFGHAVRLIGVAGLLTIGGICGFLLLRVPVYD